MKSKKSICPYPQRSGGARLTSLAPALCATCLLLAGCANAAGFDTLGNQALAAVFRIGGFVAVIAAAVVGVSTAANAAAQRSHAVTNGVVALIGIGIGVAIIWLAPNLAEGVQKALEAQTVAVPIFTPK